MIRPAGQLRSPFKNIGRPATMNVADVQAIIRAARLAAGEEPGNVDDPESPKLTVAAFQSSI